MGGGNDEIVVSRIDQSPVKKHEGFQKAGVFLRNGEEVERGSKNPVVFPEDAEVLWRNKRDVDISLGEQAEKLGEHPLRAPLIQKTIVDDRHFLGVYCFFGLLHNEHRVVSAAPI